MTLVDFMSTNKSGCDFSSCWVFSDPSHVGPAAELTPDSFLTEPNTQSAVCPLCILTETISPQSHVSKDWKR